MQTGYPKRQEILVPDFIDYETLGEHYWVESGILEFLRYLGPEMRRSDVTMTKLSKLLSCPIQEEFSIPYPISWTDAEKDMSAWIDNRKQKNAFSAIQRAKSFCKENAQTLKKGMMVIIRLNL